MPDELEEMPDDDTPVTISAKDLKALRGIAKDFGDIRQQNERAQRELAFAKAKIDITDPKMSYFVKGYEGELTAEEIRKAATTAGFISAEAPQVTSIPPSELQGHQQMGDAAAGGTSQQVDLAEKIRQAASQEEVMAIMTEAGYPTSWSTR